MWADTHEHGAYAYCHDGDGERFHAPVLVRIGTHDKTADGAHDKTDAKHHEAHEDTDNGILGREELCGNDNRKVTI